MKEIFKPINNTIIDNIIEDKYIISNFGRIYNKKTNKFFGYYSKKTYRYECSLDLNNNLKRYNLDIAKLLYCVFNNINYNNNINIKFKDNNPLNLNLDNLIDIISIANNNEKFINNSIISSADYHIKNKKILIYYTDEIWTDITDDQVNSILPIYMISNYGRVYNKLFGSILYNQISYNGYVNAIVKSKNGNYINMSIHRTMMKCFCPIENCDMYEVNHIDNNSFNNVLNNLEWVTPEINEIKMLNNTNKYRFTKEQVISICEALEKGLTYQEIAFHVLHKPYIGSLHAKISDIHRKITYTNISKKYIF